MEHYFSQTTTTTLPKILQYPRLSCFHFCPQQSALGQIVSFLCSKETQSKSYDLYNNLLASLWPISSHPLTPLTSPPPPSFSHCWEVTLGFAAVNTPGSFSPRGFSTCCSPWPKMSSPYILMPDDPLQRCNPSFPTFLIPLPALFFSPQDLSTVI